MLEGKSLRCKLGRHSWEWAVDYDLGRVCRCVRCGENGEAQAGPTGPPPGPVGDEHLP